jgi:hypothetical protein
MTFRSPRVTEDTGPPNDPARGRIWLTGEAEFETDDGEIRRVGPADVLSVLRLFERETITPHAIIRGKNGRRHEGAGGKLYKRFGPAGD